MRWRWLALTLVVCAAVVAGVVVWHAQRTPARSATAAVPRYASVGPCFTGRPGAGSGRHLPTVSLPCQGGTGPAVIVPSALAGDTPVVIAFWASYCQSCHEELTALARYAHDDAASARVLTVLTYDSAHYAELAGDLPYPLPVAFDADGRLMTALGLARALPALVVLHPDGTVAATYQGPPVTSPNGFRSLVHRAA